MAEAVAACPEAYTVEEVWGSWRAGRLSFPCRREQGHQEAHEADVSSLPLFDPPDGVTMLLQWPVSR